VTNLNGHETHINVKTRMENSLEGCFDKYKFLLSRQRGLFEMVQVSSQGTTNILTLADSRGIANKNHSVNFLRSKN